MLTEDPEIHVHRIALHEAGHAVACWIADLPFGQMQVDERGGSVHLDLDLPNIERGSDRALRVQVTYAAGAATGWFLHSMSQRFEATGQDSVEILRLGIPDGFSEEEWLTQLAWCARRLLQWYRRELAALAWQLDVRKTMTADEIRTLLNSRCLIQAALDERDALHGLPTGEERSGEHSVIAHSLWPGT